MRIPEEHLYRRLPRFAWRRPVRVVHGGEARYACRPCCALEGRDMRLHGMRTWASPEEVEEHISAEHPRAPA